MALATLNGIPFRINPSSIQWNFNIETHVDETIGGRVVQVVGATLSDITISGEYGERKGYKNDASHRGLELHGPGLLSWELAEQFINRIKQFMEEQSLDSQQQGRMQPPLDFRFPEYGWHFAVYVKAFDDGQGDMAIAHSTGTFAHRYRLTLFIVQDRSADLHQVTNPNGQDIIAKKKAEAIKGYIARISAGVGWRKSQFNDPGLIEDAVTGTVTRQSTSAADQSGQSTSSTTAPLPMSPGNARAVD